MVIFKLFFTESGFLWTKLKEDKEDEDGHKDENAKGEPNQSGIDPLKGQYRFLFCGLIR